MNKLSYTLKSMRLESTASKFLDELDRRELREVAADLGVYCQSRLRKDEIKDKILCFMFGARRAQHVTGGVTPIQIAAIDRFNRQSERQAMGL